MLIDGAEVLSDFDYKSGSGYVVLDRGTYTIAVEGVLPDGDVTVIGPLDVDFMRKMTYTVVAANSVANIEPLVFSQPIEDVSSGAARLLAIHAAAAAPTVDVYVTAPGADLGASAPIGTFSYSEQIGPAEVPAGDYQVRVTPAGNADAVVFDSGTITLNDGDDIALAAVINTSGGDAPISLVGLVGSGSFELLDVDTPTGLRVGHLSPDAGLVDVLANGAEYLTDVPFPTVTGFAALPADTYTIAVTPADMPGVFAIGPVDLDLDAGTAYSLLAVDFLSSIEALIATDDPRSVATHAKVRIIHAAPSASTVDVYVTAVGADINDETPLLSDVEFKGNTGYLPVSPGDYDVTVTAAGSKMAAIGPATITVAGGDVLTAFARDPLPGQMEFGLVLAEDMLP